LERTSKQHQYKVLVEWTGNEGTGTSGYANYKRDHLVYSGGKPTIRGSSDPSFRGDPQRWNPEELLVASIAACHKLWYLHLCSSNEVTVVSYRDEAEGFMAEDESGGGHFVRVTLRPQVAICSGQDKHKALELHKEAHAKCFIANSVNFTIDHAAVVLWEGEQSSASSQSANQEL
jgi:organic hydroperoxide reductase OsmC/OhrA